jgi:hypothetical protein
VKKLDSSSIFMSLRKLGGISDDVVDCARRMAHFRDIEANSMGGAFQL